MAQIKKIDAKLIIKEVSRLCMDANFFLPDDVVKAINEAAKEEVSELGKDIFNTMLANQEAAREKKIPICQDTGFAVIFLELGQDVHIINGDLYHAINEGVRQGYSEGYLRKSIVSDPFFRENTGDNTPAVIHTKIVSGENIKIIMAPKGGGSENMSALKMLKPSDGMEGVVSFIIETVRKAGPNPCPPIIVGVGVGGTMEKASILAKEALLRPLGQRNIKSHIASMEEELEKQINCLGIGPQGLGGRVTTLGVNVEVHPTHIASLPVAVNINCHVSRHKSILL